MSLVTPGVIQTASKLLVSLEALSGAAALCRAGLVAGSAPTARNPCNCPGHLPVAADICACPDAFQIRKRLLFAGSHTYVCQPLRLRMGRCRCCGTCVVQWWRGKS